MVVEGKFRGFIYAVSINDTTKSVYVMWHGPRNWYSELSRGANLWAGSKVDMPIEEFWNKLDIGRSTPKADEL